jgi:uncharacterized MAPEG superfamily protein
MSIAFWCLFVAGLFHIISKVPLSKAQAECEGGYDNANPRGQQEALTGWGRRALAMHQNQIESFPLFAVGVLVAHIGGVPAETSDMLAGVYILFRVLFFVAYLKNWSTPRSLCWAVGFFSSLALMCSPAWA